MADPTATTRWPRMTAPTMAVLDVLTAATDDSPPYGLSICRDADLGPGTVYPILERLAERGWVESWQEAEQPAGRPRRRFYRLTDTGRADKAQALVARAARRARWTRRTGDDK